MPDFDTTTVPRTQIRRSKLCKFCTSFQTEQLDVINEDIVLRRRTFAQLINDCNTHLPEGASPFSYDNIASHKKHVDVKKILSDYSLMEGAEEDPSLLRPDPIEEGVQQLAALLTQIRNVREVQKEQVLDFLYEDRLRNIYWLQERLSTCKEAFVSFPSEALGRQINVLVNQLSELESSLTKDILGHLRIEETTRTAAGAQHLASHTEDLLRLIAVRLVNVMGGNPETIKVVIREVAWSFAQIGSGELPEKTSDKVINAEFTQATKRA